MKSIKTTWLVIVGSTIALIIVADFLRGHSQAPIEQAIALMIGQAIGVSLIPLAVGGIAYLVKRTTGAFFTGWLIGFAITGIGFLYQALYESGRM